MDIGTKPMKLTRVADDGSVTVTDILGDDHGSGLAYFKVDADIEVGDEVAHVLPNGKTRTLRIVEVRVRQAPDDFTSDLDHTEAAYEVVNARPTIRQPRPLTLSGMHPLISAAAGSKIASCHYDNAVFDAFKAVEERVQVLAGNPTNSRGAPLSGHGLMAAVFDERDPMLDITSDVANTAQKADERAGYKYTFMGVTQSLRNPRAHGVDLMTPEPEAMSMLATASMLMHVLDRAERRLRK